MVRHILLFILLVFFTKCGDPVQNYKQPESINKKDSSQYHNLVAPPINNSKKNPDTIDPGSKSSSSSVIYTKQSLRHKLMGIWSINGTADSDEFMNNEHIEIHLNTSIFDMPQLALGCKNVYHKDTLYLYVVDADAARGFWGPKYFPPDPKSLFAKCYLVDSGLGIYYTQKLFRNNMKALELSNVLYKIETPATQIDE
jgi:hypothetical protein